MNNTNQKLKLFYLQYRDFIQPLSVIIVCIILFILVVIPQIQGYFALQAQFEKDKQRLQVLQQNFQKVTGLNDQQLQSNFETTAKALPDEKNSVAVLNTIANAAGGSNISLKDYNFAIGSTSDKDKDHVLHVTLSLTGSMSDIQKFIQQLYQHLPLSEVSTINIENNNAAIMNISFYLQPVAKTTINTNTPLELLTDQDRTLLNKLSTWQ